MPTPPSLYWTTTSMLRSSPAIGPGRNPRADSTSRPALASRSIQCTPPSKSAPPPTIAGSSRQPGRRCPLSAMRLKYRISPNVPDSTTSRSTRATGL